MQSKLYPELVKVLQQYLGPAAERFAVRQIDIYLGGKKPEDLSSDDLRKLEGPISISLSHLADDEAIRGDLAGKISQLK